ncbi:MAG: S24 family peptidase [Chloroflexi bacterium]|nr:S24 family peptidase [Chloroflexota bacterium]MBI3341377.1 S24 family peptidase [Chloroflexota bacterium]
MNDEITNILKGYLLVEEESLTHIMRDIFELCKSERGASEAIVRLEAMLADYSSGLEFLDKVPLYYLFLAYAQYKWGRLPDSVKSTSDAIRGFKQQNQVRNNAIGLWMRAWIYRESDHIETARQDIIEGIELIERELGDSKRTSHYQECKDCETIHLRMADFRDGLDGVFQKETQKPKASHTGTSNQSPSSRENESYLSFPIYVVHAGLDGEIVYGGAPLNEAIIETIIIGNKLHRIHSLRERPEVVLRPAIYRWLQVQGDSMECAYPVPILEGDCVLVIDIIRGDYIPQYGDIVVAARHIMTGSEGGAVIKRFTSKGLCSESNASYRPISLMDVDIRGLAIAVAKPAK